MRPSPGSSPNGGHSLAGLLIGAGILAFAVASQPNPQPPVPTPPFPEDAQIAAAMARGFL